MTIILETMLPPIHVASLTPEERSEEGESDYKEEGEQPSDDEDDDTIASATKATKATKKRKAKRTSKRPRKSKKSAPPAVTVKAEGAAGSHDTAGYTGYKFRKLDKEIDQEVAQIAVKIKNRPAFVATPFEAGVQVTATEDLKSIIYARKQEWINEYVSAKKVGERSGSNAWMKRVEKLSRRIAFKTLLAFSFECGDAPSVLAKLQSTSKHDLYFGDDSNTQQSAHLRSIIAKLISSAAYTSNPSAASRMLPTLFLDLSITQPVGENEAAASDQQGEITFLPSPSPFPQTNNLPADSSVITVDYRPQSVLPLSTFPALSQEKVRVPLQADPETTTTDIVEIKRAETALEDNALTDLAGFYVGDSPKSQTSSCSVSTSLQEKPTGQVIDQNKPAEMVRAKPSSGTEIGDSARGEPALTKELKQKQHSTAIIPRAKSKVNKVIVAPAVNNGREAEPQSTLIRIEGLTVLKEAFKELSDRVSDFVDKSIAQEKIDLEELSALHRETTTRGAALLALQEIVNFSKCENS